LSLCLIDIDIFKDINDKWGHPAGDQVLRHLASMLLLSVRNSDVVGRLGGDEFGIVLTGADLNDAYTTMLKLCMDIAATPCAVEMGLIPFAVSIGVAGLKLPEMDWAALSKAADENLYKAKQSGRNCVIAR
jgi:diguanylate cyclase (GGDEF)-like protein